MQRKITNISLLKSYLIEINPTDYTNDPNKLDFLGNYANPNSRVKLLRSTNKIKVNELLRALKVSTCWEKPIFNDSHLPYYAITAYLQDKISREQISHILEFYELKSTYPDIISIPILTREGNFSHASKEYFSSVIRTQRSKLPNVTTEHLEKFRLSLLDGRKKTTTSSYILHILPSHGVGSGHVGFSSLLGSIDSYEMGTVFMPGPVRNIFYPAITPKNSTKTISTGALGKFSIDAIERGHRKNIRIHALGFPGAFRTTRAHIHNTTLADISGHDATHQGALSYFPEHLYHMSLHCLEVVRKRTGIKWSEELWPLIDMFVIDSSVNVLNQKNDPNDHAFARTYSINETLSDSQCQQWMVRLLNTALSVTLFNIILHDMTINKSMWEQWIDVDSFVKTNIHEQFNQALQKPLTINELAHEDNIHQQIIFGFIANWQSITNTILSKLIRFEKNDNNMISLYLFGETIKNYSNDELKTILIDTNQSNLAGIKLINSAASGNIVAVKKIMASITPSNSFDYVLLALRMAAKHGHANCVEYILNNRKINNSSTYYQHGLEDAAAAGYTKCVELLLDKNNDSLAEKTIHSALLLSAKRGKPKTVSLLLGQHKCKISVSALVNAIAAALDHDDAVIAKMIFSYATKKGKIQTLIDDLTIYKMLRSSPINCISVIMDALIGHSYLTYQQLFTAIAKSGSTECANEFINYINKQYENNDVKRNKLLMECMLEGFSSVTPRYYFTQPFNLHHDMVKLQINQYVKSSAFNHMLLDQNQNPKKDDIEQLIEKIFSTSFKHDGVSLYTLSDMALHHLIRHPMLKENQELHTYCLNIAVDKAIHHQEPYYLRLLLRAGVALTFSHIQDDSVNGTLIKNLPSQDVKCLLWLTCAINELKQYSPTDLIIMESFKNAELCSSFENEIFSLIYGNSAQISIHTLRCLFRHFGDGKKFASVKQLISERIEFLQESDFHSVDQFNLGMFNNASSNLYPVVTDTLEVYGHTYG